MSVPACRRRRGPVAGHAGNRIRAARLRTSLRADGPATGPRHRRHFRAASCASPRALALGRS